MYVEGAQVSRWAGSSEPPKQFHLDFEVDDIEAEQSRVLTLGATLQQATVEGLAGGVAGGARARAQPPVAIAAVGVGSKAGAGSWRLSDGAFRQVGSVRPIAGLKTKR